MEFLEKAKKTIEFVENCEEKQKIAVNSLSNTHEAANKAKERQEVAKKGLAVIQDVAQRVQAQLEHKITSLVNMAIMSVFDDAPKFKMEIVIRRNKTECDLLFVEGDNKSKPIDSSGGGLLDVVSFALRVVIWTFTESDNTLILDEPFKYLSPRLSSKVSKMLSELSKTLGLQIIMVSHAVGINEAAQRTFHIEKTGKLSVVNVME